MPDILAEAQLAADVRLRLVHGDLTEEHVDAIVNAANANLAHGGGLAAAIVRRGGKQVQQESDAWVRRHGPIDHDRPAITGAGELPCRYVLHAVGPRWRGGSSQEDEKLARTIRGVLALATERGFESLALPAISTGIFGYPKARAARVILDAIQETFDRQPESSLQDIRITLFDQPSVDAFMDEFTRRWPGESSTT